MVGGASVHLSKHSLFRLKITVGCRLCAYPSIHLSPDEDTLKFTVGCRLCAYPSVHTKTLRITVGCPPCTYPSIHVETLRITVGCLWSTYPSIRNKNLHTCWTPWSTQETRGLWARPPVLTPVPSQAIHSRACLNLHHSDIQGTAQKSPCVNTFLRPEKKKETFLSLSLSLGRTPTDTTTERHDTRDNGHVRQQRDDVFFLGRWLLLVATKRRAMQRSKLDIGRADAGDGGMSIISGSGGASGMGASSSSSDASSMAQSTGSSGAGSGSMCLAKSSSREWSAAASAPRASRALQGPGTTAYQCCKHSQSVQDCASFVSSSRNSNRTATRSSPHAWRPSIVDTSKNKSANSGKRTTERAIRRAKEKMTSVISKKKKKSRERIFHHYGFNYFEKQ